MPRISTDIEDFYPQNRDALLPLPTTPCTTATEVLEQKLPFLFLDLPFAVPHAAMLAEARAARPLFFEHRSNKRHGHRGWLTLSVIDDDLPGEGAAACPITHAFFRQTFGFLKYYQVRFTIVTGGGAILPHVDADHRRVLNDPYDLSGTRHLNLALNNPQGCEFVMQNAGVLPMHPGCAVHLNTAVAHAVWNRSTIDRYHILVHGIFDETTHWPETLLRSYNQAMVR